ncbi:MAG: family 16 glycosylhydrolase [bacterium]
MVFIPKSLTACHTSALVLTAFLFCVGATSAADSLAYKEFHGLRLWLDASDATTLEVQGRVVTQGRIVTRWRDKSGANNHAEFKGEPIVSPSDFNGHPAIRMRGREMFNVRALAKEPGPITAFVVSRRTETQAIGDPYQRLLSIRSGKTSDLTPPNLSLCDPAFPVPYAPTVRVVTGEKIAPGLVGIGCVPNSNSWDNAFHGDIAEVLIYSGRTLSEAAFHEVMEYLATKWGATPARDESGWTRIGLLGPTPRGVRADLPLSDQQNRGGWTKFEPFSDEFDGTSLDPNKWEPFRRGWKGRQPALFYSPNVKVENSCLTLTMRKETVPEMKEDPTYHTYTSAAMESTQYTRYGYFEIRARAMNSSGSSSFWFAGGTRDWGTEIDVFELGGNAPGFERSYNMNAHVWREGGKSEHWNTKGIWRAPWRFIDDFHVYGLEWSPQKLIYYVDGVPVRSLPNTHWHKPMRLILDSETFPDWFGLPKDQDLPSTFHVDYIRSWKRPGWEGVILEEQLESQPWDPLK